MAGKITIEELDSTLKSTINNKVDNSTMTTQLNNKINTSAIKNDLTSGGASNVLSAAQGVVLKGLVDSKADSATVTQQLGTKINTSAIKNDLTTGGSANVLSAEQGKTLKGLVDGKASKSDLNSKINTSAIKDDLVTGGASNVLSAEQGVIIKGLIDALSEKIDAVGGGASGDIAELIASKVPKSDIVNDLTTGGETKVLSAEQGVALKALVDAKASKTDLSGKADTATVNSQLSGKINTSAIKNDLTSGGASNVLSAEQGKALKKLIDSLTSTVSGKADASQLAGKVNTADIVDDLITGGETKVLSAAQGKTLKGLVDGKASKSELAGKADASQLAGKVNTADIINDLITGGTSKVLSAQQGVALKGLVDGKISTSLIKNDLTGGAGNVLSAEQGKALKTLIDSLTSKVDGKADKTPVSTTVDGLMTAKDKVKLDTIAYGANSYAHPPTHPPSVIAQDATHRFMTDAERKLIQAWEEFKASGGEIGGITTFESIICSLLKTNVDNYNQFGVNNSGGEYAIQLYDDLGEWKSTIFKVLPNGDIYMANGTNKSTNGYNKLTNGFIEQWGVVNITGQAPNVWCTGWSIQYPKLFPNEVISLNIQILGDGNNHDSDLRVVPYLTENTNTFQYHCKVGANGTLKFKWRALGY